MPSARARLKNVDLKISKDGIRAQTARVLRQAIIGGDFLPGQRLVEVDLCEALQISRPSLREALRHLESERLVNFVPNRGCFVTELEWTDAEQIYETRALLEPEMTFRAATRASEDLVEELRESVEQFRSAVEQTSRIEQVSASDRFYNAIFEAADNAIMKDILEGLNARISVMRGRSMSHPGRATHSLAELEAISSAIANGNPDKARDAARVHIENACKAARLAMQKDYA